MPDTARADKVWVTVGVDTDYEQPYAYKANGPDEDGDGPHSYTFELPSEQWDRFERAQDEWQAALDDLIASTPFDVDMARLVECCPRWAGYVVPESTEWVVVRPQRDGSSTFLDRDLVGRADTEADAGVILAALPDTFWLHSQGRLQRARHDEFVVQERSFRSHTSDCRACGWPRDEHADRGEPVTP